MAALKVEVINCDLKHTKKNHGCRIKMKDKKSVYAIKLEECHKNRFLAN